MGQTRAIQMLPQSSVAGDSGQLLLHLDYVLGIHDDGGIPQDFSQRTACGRNYRSAASHGFNRWQAESFK